MKDEFDNFFVSPLILHPFIDHSPLMILITGSAGRIGQAVVRELNSQGRPLRGFDLMPTPGIKDSLVGNISDTEAVCQAARGVQAIIHLAAIPDDDDFLTK